MDKLWTTQKLVYAYCRLFRDVIRGYALGNGLVDVKVCAVSEQWSGLKLVVPLSKR